MRCLKATVKFLQCVATSHLTGINAGVCSPGIVARQIRSAMLEQLSEDYIVPPGPAACPAGISFYVMRYQCVDPIDYRIGAGAGRFVVWAVLTETVFAWPGMGAWVVTSYRRSTSRQ